MAITTAIAIATTVAAGSTAYSAYEASKARDEAQNQSSKTQFEAKAASDEAAKQSQIQKDTQAAIDKGQQDQDTNNMNILLAERKRQAYGGDYTKGGTLLTGPTGVQTPGPTANKTLLGQ